MLNNVGAFTDSNKKLTTNIILPLISLCIYGNGLICIVCILFLHAAIIGLIILLWAQGLGFLMVQAQPKPNSSLQVGWLSARPTPPLSAKDELNKYQCHMASNALSTYLHFCPQTRRMSNQTPCCGVRPCHNIQISCSMGRASWAYLPVVGDIPRAWAARAPVDPRDV